MKLKFNTYDLVCSVAELQKLVGMRVNQIYDIDHKTYLIRLQKSETKCMLLLEAGCRIHTTDFEWPKNISPSGFTMKLRKHLKNKRLESLTQIGVDRIINLQFGSGEAAYHIILEVYDRGNIILTDYEMAILNILRPHTKDEQSNLKVKEKYTYNGARTKIIPEKEEIIKLVQNAKSGETLKKILNPHLETGPAIIDHVLLQYGFSAGYKIDEKKQPIDFDKLLAALEAAESMIINAKNSEHKGYIIKKKEMKKMNDAENFLLTNIEYHPYLFEQNKNQLYEEFDSFNIAVDNYYSQMESQKVDLKILQKEKEAFKKLENVKKDHDQRLQSLLQVQESDKVKAELITRNQKLVENAILAIQSALANQMSWNDIKLLLEEIKLTNDPVACVIKELKLEKNQITLLLDDPYKEGNETGLQSMKVDIDLDLSAYGNARKYYTQKRVASKKQQKTIESQSKAFKSAEKKTKQSLKEVQNISNINKIRKIYWFEKFHWFITSENYLIIGGRDQQQNELIVKKYLKSGDIYVHADLSGASSVVIKNSTGQPVSPKSLAEAAVMAVAYSIAWEAKIISGVWWVNSDQVSKTAPTGEYLTTGSFMIRGKKNYLPTCQLVMGFGIMFRLEDNFVENHKNERRIKSLNDEETEHIVAEVTDDCIQTSAEISDDKIQASDISDDSIQTIAEISDENIQSVSEISDESIKTDHKEHAEAGTSESNKTSFQKTNFMFPDTQINLDCSSLKVELQEVEIHESNPCSSSSSISNNIETNNKRTQINKQPNCAAVSEPTNDESNLTHNKNMPTKRGQRWKLKKIKEKYKDQDEEDRKLSMSVLQSAGAVKNKKGKIKNKNIDNLQTKKRNVVPEKKVPENIPSSLRIDDELEIETKLDMLDCLTGSPFQDDELLFAVPVIAPYATLQKYKYKVKLTPGISKKGKAVKTAISMFLAEKNIPQRDKDLIKSIKIEEVARNLPGKVKIHVAQQQKRNN